MFVSYVGLNFEFLQVPSYCKARVSSIMKLLTQWMVQIFYHVCLLYLDIEELHFDQFQNQYCF